MRVLANNTPQPLPESVTLPDPVTVSELAAALHLKVFRVIRSLIEFDVFARSETALDFNTASRLCGHYGVAATKFD